MLNLIQIYYDTEKLCREDETLTEAIRHTIDNQYIVHSPGDIRLKPERHRFSTPANIVVSQKRSLEAARAYPTDRICVLNFASATHAGGGVRQGARAQEECLFRCSTLLFAISDPATEEDFHLRHRQLISSGKMDALYNDDCIFSPGITVIKTDTELPHRLMEADRYHVDVITCAAPNLNPYFHRLRITAVQLKELHQQRARRILDIGVSEREDVMILGAFGCGAFRNPPEVVAEAYGEVIRDYLYDFKTIEFAVYCPPHSEGKNYHAFRHALTP